MATEKTSGGSSFRIDSTWYERSNILIVAEIGTAHGGDLYKARQLANAAIDAGADAVKFQHVYADEILHPNTGTVPLPSGNVSLYDAFRMLEVSIDFFAVLKDEIEARGCLFLCTPFGVRSAREIRSLNPRFLKIASPELNHFELLEETSTYGLPMILSTGVSRLTDIEKAIEYFPMVPVCLLHCVTAYPAPEIEYNLALLRSLRTIFGLPIGLSDHSADPVMVPALAAALGAVVIEKHFCLSRHDSGLDDAIALPPDAFARMVATVREASRLSPRAALKGLKSEYGSARVRSALGDGVKRLALSERANYGRTNRSIHALRSIKAGETIAAEAVAVLRTEKILRPGLPPDWRQRIIGRQARNDIPVGEGVRFEDV